MEKRIICRMNEIVSQSQHRIQNNVTERTRGAAAAPSAALLQFRSIILMVQTNSAAGRSCAWSSFFLFSILPPPREFEW